MDGSYDDQEGKSEAAYSCPNFDAEKGHAVKAKSSVASAESFEFVRS